MRVAIIPARGGSKRLPRKNIIDFLGKPMIAYSIEAAKKSESFSEVVVSTEDEEIATIADSYGATVDMRADNLATDDARVSDVCVDFLTRRFILGTRYDVMCVMYATAPLRNAQDIRSMVELLEEDDGCKGVMAVTEFDLPVHQCLNVAPDAFVSPVFPELANKRADQAPSYCVDNGSTYVVDVSAFLESRSFYADGMRGYLMERSRSVDIDTRDDLELALYYAGRGRK